MIQKILLNCDLARKNSLSKKNTLDIIKEIFHGKTHYFYLWYFFWYHLSKYNVIDFDKIPKKYIIKIKKYLKILKWNNLENIPNHFYEILILSDRNDKYRDFLFWWLSFVLWEYMNHNKNINNSVKIWLELIKKAFSLDNFNYKKKLSYAKNNDEKIICISWSWKKDSKYKLLNISSMSAVITAWFWLRYWKNIIVSKVGSKSTSSVSWSEDIFSFLWVNLLSHSNDEMLQISKKSKLWVYSIWNIVPKLNHVYDNRLYNVNVFAWLVWWPAIVNPVEWDLIYYWLTSWNWEITSNILQKIYKKNILVINWENKNWKQVIDQFSLDWNSNIDWFINNKSVKLKLSPNDFWIDLSNYDWVCSSDNLKDNAKIFLDLISWKSSENLKNIVAMETTMQLFWLWIIEDIKYWFSLVKETINSWIWIKVLENLILLSWWNLKEIKSYLYEK